MRVNELLSKFDHIANNPREMMDKYLADGYKVVGCFPVFCPGEIVEAAGMVPMGLWGGKVEFVKSKEYFPAFCCSMIMGILEFGITGAYKGMSAALIPGMSDTMITLSQNWKSSVKDIPMIGFVHPQNRKIQAGIDYLASEYELIKSKLEEIVGHEITEDDLKKSIEIYNEHRKAMMEFVELVPDYMNTITPRLRNVVMKSAHFMRKEEHTELVKELNAELKKMPKEDFKGKKVLVTGLLLDDAEILDVLEKNNIGVAYDNVAHESLQYKFLVPEEGTNQIDRLAKQWSLIEGCSVAYDPYKLRGKIVTEDVKRLGIDAVLFALIAFSDYEEYDYPIFKKDMEKAGIPHLHFEWEQGAASIEQIRTRIQTFAEIIG